MKEFEQRHVVITGGTGALGTAVVQAFLEAGAVCHVPSRHAPPEGELTHERLHILPGVELTDEDSVIAFYAGLPSLWASVHLAGGFAMKPVAETSLSDFRAQYDINTVTCFLCCREAVRSMREKPSEGPVGGRIVNVSSRPALVQTGGMIAYTASKGAVASITQSLAEEVKEEGILVNAVVPSIIDTPVNRTAMPNADHDRWPRPEEIARTILYLASPENALTTGALVPVYGRA